MAECGSRTAWVPDDAEVEPQAVRTVAIADSDEDERPDASWRREEPLSRVASTTRWPDGPRFESRRRSDAGGTSSATCSLRVFRWLPARTTSGSGCRCPSRRGRSRRGECDRIGVSGVAAGSRSTSRMGVTSRVRCAGYGALTRQPRSACPASPAERTTSPEDALRCRKRGAGADFGLDALHVDKRNQGPRQRGHHR